MPFPLAASPTHLDPQIGVRQHLELPGLVVLVRDDQGGGEAGALQGDAVDDVELVGPQLPGGGVERGAAEPEVELDREVLGGRVAGRLAGRLAQELPPRRARKPVLRQLGRGGVVGRGAEDLNGTAVPTAPRVSQEYPLLTTN